MDPDVAYRYIDAKFNATTHTKQIADIRRVAEALRQNPSASVVLELAVTDRGQRSSSSCLESTSVYSYGPGSA
jgi:hypothetical protein